MKVTFIRDGYQPIENLLPMTEEEYVDTLRTLDVEVNKYFTEEKNCLTDSTVIDEIFITYDENTASCGFGNTPSRLFADNANFIEVNLFAKAWEDLMDGIKYEIYDGFINEYETPNDLLECINLILEIDEDYVYYYDYGANDYSPEACFAQNLYGYEVNDCIWDYVDWETLGEDAAGERRLILCDNGYYDLDDRDIDTTCRDLEGICDDIGWDYDYDNFFDYVSNIEINKSGANTLHFTQEALLAFLKGCESHV